MPRYEKTTGETTEVLETSNAVEGTRLKAEGYTEHVARTAAVRTVDVDNPAVPEHLKPKSSGDGNPDDDDPNDDPTT